MISLNNYTNFAYIKRNFLCMLKSVFEILALHAVLQETVWQQQDVMQCTLRLTAIVILQNVPVGPNNRPKLPVVISQCGEM